MKTVWITRTQPFAQRSAARFKDAGFHPIIAPLLLIGPPPVIPPMPPRGAVLIFTSQNGLNAFCGLSDFRGHAVVTVGNATAGAVRKAGFTDVISADGTAKDVAPLILQNPQRSSPYWHIAGRHVRGSIIEDLRTAGLSAARHVFYISRPVDRLPKIDMSSIDVTALYSPLAAKTLAALSPDMSKAAIVSISAETDAALGAFDVGRRIIADTPNEESMLVSLIALTA